MSFDIDKFNKDMSDLYFKAEKNSKIARLRRSRKVAGRMKLAAGKKARAENKGSTEFEMELVHFLKHTFTEEDGIRCHVFRSPASKTPVDVWVLRNNLDPNFTFNAPCIYCYQCKTTRDTKPPRINKKEFEDFRAFCTEINAQAYWVDRWKLNKGQYVRRIRGINSEGRFYPAEEDFSRTLSQIKQGRKQDTSTASNSLGH